MRVNKLMTTDIVTAKPTDTARDVARKMMEKNVGSVIVTENRKCVGIVTDRQITVHVVGKDLNPADVPVSDIMVDNPTTVQEEETVFNAAHVCSTKGPFRRVPVVNANDEVVGILSVADLATIAHPLMEAVMLETEASVDEVKVQELDIKRKMRERVSEMTH